jgi:hypothetical protein
MIFIPFILIYLNKSPFLKSWPGIIAICLILFYIRHCLCKDDSQRDTPNSRQITIFNFLKTFFRLWNIAMTISKSIDLRVSIESRFPTQWTDSHCRYYGRKLQLSPHVAFRMWYQRHLSRKWKNYQNNNFLLKTGIWSANSTLLSLKFMANAIYEPDNLTQTGFEMINFFQLAKQNAFQAFYFSIQCHILVSRLGGAQYVDCLVSRDTDPIQNRCKKDFCLLNLIWMRTFSNNNFIVLR